jgi:lipopolysaccharide transport system permease protein
VPIDERARGRVTGADVSSTRRLELSPTAPLSLIWKHRFLISRLARREIEQRYRGSVLGILWSLVTPLLLLLVYTFAFSVVFRVRWGDQPESHSSFALVLFAGLIVFGCFGEVMTRAPTLILGHVSYVKKVVFPTEILVPVLLAGAFFQLAINTGVLLAALLLVRAELAWTVVLFPLVLLPLALLLLGLGWVLSALGVFFRDIGQLTGLLVTLTMFLVPLFYPLESVPPSFREIVSWNPLAYLIEESRRLLLWGDLPHWRSFGLMVLGTWLAAWLGYLTFAKVRRGFADVL